MDKNKVLKYLLVTIFFILTAVLPLSWYLMPEKLRSENSENRILSELSLPDGLDELFALPDALTAWYNDHLPFKEAMVQAESELEIAIFNQLDSDHATLGTKKPWLFYKEKDGDQVENYKHTDSFDFVMLSEIKDELYRLKNKLSENSIELVLLIAPDKETIYGEYMPSYIKVFKDNPARTDVLLAYLSENAPDINVIFPREELLNAKTSSTVYYESDTHWNRVGAKVAFDALMDRLSSTDNNYANTLIDIGFTDIAYDGISGFTAGEHMWYEGDIQKLCRLPSSYNSSEYYPDRPPYAVTLDRTISPGGEVIAQHSISSSDTYADKKICFCGDSYRWQLVDYVREGFRESTVISRYYLDLDEVIAEQPDIFVYEVPERYLADLHGLPGVSAPALEITDEYERISITDECEQVSE